jgi:hypothetical protein
LCIRAAPQPQKSQEAWTVIFGAFGVLPKLADMFTKNFSRIFSRPFHDDALTKKRVSTFISVLGFDAYRFVEGTSQRPTGPEFDAICPRFTLEVPSFVY